MAQSKIAEEPDGAETEEFVAELEREEVDSNAAADVVEAEPEAADSNPAASLQDLLAAATQESEMYKDRFLRARADLENYRKRSLHFVAEGVRDAQKQTFEAILPVVDNLERAVAFQEQHQTDAVDDLLTGVRMTLLQIMEVLERQEVKRIEALGEPFDPRFHEAVEVQAAEGDAEVDTVVGELQTGYLIGDAVLRPARVRVAQPRRPAGDA